MGKRTVGMAAVVARRVPRHRAAPPTARRCGVASPCSRPVSRWCSPGGRAQVRPGGAAAVRRRRLRRPARRGADRPGRHRRFGAGDAQGRPVPPPAQGPRHRRRTDRVAAAAPSPGGSRGRRSAGTATSCTPRCRSCSTPPSERVGLLPTRRPSRSTARRAAISSSRRRGRPSRCAGIVGAAQLAGRVHRQLRHADVDGGDPETGRRERPDRRPARDVVARDERLHRHAGLLAARPEQRRRRRVGGVALVGVELDRRAVG